MPQLNGQDDYLDGNLQVERKKNLKHVKAKRTSDPDVMLFRSLEADIFLHDLVNPRHRNTTPDIIVDLNDTLKLIVKLNY